jgi:hypothetical protein
MRIAIEVELFGALRDQVGASRRTLDLPAGACVRDALLALGLPDRVDIWALVDGARAERDAPLPPGARLRLFQPVGGG